MPESPSPAPDIETLRIALDRLGLGLRDEAWLERFANELSAVVAMGRKLDELDLSNEEPASIFINPRG